MIRPCTVASFAKIGAFTSLGWAAIDLFVGYTHAVPVQLGIGVLYLAGNLALRNRDTWRRPHRGRRMDRAALKWARVDAGVAALFAAVAGAMHAVHLDVAAWCFVFASASWLVLAVTWLRIGRRRSIQATAEAEWDSLVVAEHRDPATGAITYRPMPRLTTHTIGRQTFTCVLDDHTWCVDHDGSGPARPPEGCSCYEFWTIDIGAGLGLARTTAACTCPAMMAGRGDHLDGCPAAGPRKRPSCTCPRPNPGALFRPTIHRGDCPSLPQLPLHVLPNPYRVGSEQFAYILDHNATCRGCTLQVQIVDVPTTPPCGCRHAEHSDQPGVGCTTPGCLCVETPDRVKGGGN